MRRGRRIPGIAIFKPGCRSKSERELQNLRYVVEYQEPGRTSPTRKFVSADFEITWRYALTIYRRLEEQRLGLFSERDRRYAEFAATPLLPQPPAIAQKLPPKSHVEEYEAVLLARGRTSKWAQMVRSRVETLFAEGEFEFIDDISADGVDLALGAVADREEWSDQTMHHYLDAAKQFTRWLRRSRRARFDELEDMPARKVVDVEHKRRPLDELEINQLLAAARSGDDYVWWGSRVITGKQRELVYILALETGLRANELRTLTPECFSFGASPRVSIEARDSKHRRRDELPLRADTAGRLQRYLKGCRAGRRIWELPDKPYLMMEFDLDVAGIPYRTLYGVADFHALRHTFCTRLASAAGRTGDSARTCQILMRHGDLRITQRYMHSTLQDQQRTIDGLPGLGSSAQRQALKATGTDGVSGPVAGRDGSARPPKSASKSPFQEIAQETLFPSVPQGTLLFPPQGGATPVPVAGKAPIPQAEWQISKRRSTEPKVAGSSPARCDPQTPPTAADAGECQEVNDIPTSAVSGTGAGNDGSTPTAALPDAAESIADAAAAALSNPHNQEQLDRIEQMLAQLLRGKEGGGT